MTREKTTKDDKVKREAGGLWAKGKSANPGGRPAVFDEVRKLAQKNCPEAIRTLVSIMKDKKQNGRTRNEAADKVLDRGIGKPTQGIAPDTNPDGLTWIDVVEAAAKAAEEKKV